MFKFIGIIVGSFIGGFWGGLLGLIVGGVIDSFRHSKNHYQEKDFTKILLILSSYVVKSDNNNMLRSELKYIKDYLLKTLGPDRALNALNELKEIMQVDYNIADVCQQLNRRATIHEKLFILQFLFGLSASDGECNPIEVEAIRNISDWCNISRNDFESLRLMYSNYHQQNYSDYQSYNSSSRGYYRTANLDDDYKILEISSDATDEEVKKAYRAAAKKHHPDKVNHLGEDIRKAAEEKFAKLNESYERIKKARGMN